MSNQTYKLYFLDGPRRGKSITVSRPYSWFEVPVERKLDLGKFVGQADRVELSKPEFIRYIVRNLGGALFGVCETSDEQFMLLVRNAMLWYLGLLQKQPPPAIRVFAIHDDPEQHEHHEDRIWIAIAAEDERQALALAAAYYDGEAVRDEWNWTTAFHVSEVDTANWPEGKKPRSPQRICCPEVQRLMGWKEEGESECDSCGLAPNGLRWHKLRDCCDRCPACCDCTEEERIEHDDEIPF